MQEKEIPMKNKIIYGVCLCLVVFLLWIGDEGKQPLSYTGSRLQYSVGLVDSEESLVIQESVARNGIVASTPKYVMNRGTYTISLDCLAEKDGSVLELWEQGSKIAGWPLESGRANHTCTFTLPKDVKELQLRINYSGKGALTVKCLQVIPRTLFYTDTYFVIVVFLLLNLCGYLLYQRNRKNPIPQEKLVEWGVIIGVALLANSPMLQTYLYNGDDLCYHLARMEGIKDGILDGQIGVNILPEGLKGNGYLNSMYPYLFLYVGAFLRICRVSLGLSYKTVIFLANLGSAVCAYYAMKSMTDSRRSILLAVVLYTLMPYRFTNIFSRGDLGEILALVFWPLIIAGIYHILLGDRRKWYYLVIGLSGALQSHILSVMFAAVFCVLTALFFCGRIFKEKRYIEIGKAAGLFLLLNAWYIVPFLYYYFQEDLAKEVLRWSSYFEQSVNLSNMTQSISLYNKQYFSLGLALFGCLGIGVVYLICEHRREKTQMDGFLLYLMILGCVLTWMATGYFPNRTLFESSFWNPIVTMIQFPWRFLGPASACFVFVGALGLSGSNLLKPYRNLIFTMLVGLNLLVIISVPADNNHMPYINADSVASKGHESKLASNIGLFYPHEWRLNGASDEKLTSTVVVSDSNNVWVSSYEKKGTKATVTYSASADGCYIELPIQSYGGYRAKDENGNRVKLYRGEGMRIRIEATGDGIEHTIHVRYGPVPGFVIANILSGATLITVACWAWGKRKTGGPRFFRRRGRPEKLS